MGQYIQYIFLILFIGGPILQWIIRKLNEQAQARKVEQLRQQARAELLRTGRDPDAEALQQAEQRRQRAIQQQQEIAARRQAQLEELRRRQAEAQQRRTAPQRPQPTAAPPTQRAPAQRTPAQQRGPVIGPAPSRAQSARPPHTVRVATPQQQEAQRAARRTADAAESARRTQQTHLAEAARQRAAAAKPAPKRPAASTPQAPGHSDQPAPRRPISTLALPMTPQGWRSAFVMQEILRPPVSLRSEPGPFDPL